MRTSCMLTILWISISSLASADESTVQKYLDMSAGGQTPDTTVLRGFPAVFENLDGEDLASRIEDAYAESIYFNDTLVVITERPVLIDYLLKSGERTNFVNTKILDVAQSGEDVYVRWQLQMSFDVMGAERRSDTVGMTHLRFDDSGKITLHQDFWDSASGFYQVLPVVGRLITWVRGRLHP